MKDYARIVTKIRETAWLMTPEALDALLTMADERMRNGKLNDEELIARLNDTERGMLFHDGERSGNGNGSIAGGIGVLPIMGPIFGRANMMTQLSGATSLETFASEFKNMLNDDGISSIILDIDSPGGSSDMIHETGELIREGSNIKPIYAHANGMAGSAAYWLASQASKLYVSPSGSVGSIGVYTVHEDQSVKDSNEGKRFTFISAGPHKTEGNPHEPLSDEAREYRQDQINKLYDQFVNVVAEGRGVSAKEVTEKFGGGRMLLPADALEAGMVDGIRSFDQLVSEVANQPQKIKVVRSSNSANANASQFLTGTLIDGVVHLESKEWEHSEPGTGNPPEPRKDEDGSDDIAIVQGWRRTTPPPQDQPSGTSASVVPFGSSKLNSDIKSTKGGYGMNDEFVLDGKNARKLFSAVGLDAEADVKPEQVVEALQIRLGELDSLRNAVSAAEQERIFAETYPQYWEEHRKLMERDREHTAANFVGSVLKIRKTEGYGLKDTKQTLSVETQNTLMATHKKFSEGQGTLEDFEKAIKSIVNGGVVQLGEIGHSKEDGETPEFDTNSAVGVANARKLFAEQVAKAQRDNPGMSYTQALAEASKKHPDLAEAYKITLPA